MDSTKLRCRWTKEKVFPIEILETYRRNNIDADWKHLIPMPGKVKIGKYCTLVPEVSSILQKHFYNTKLTVYLDGGLTDKNALETFILGVKIVSTDSISRFQKCNKEFMVSCEKNGVNIQVDKVTFEKGRDIIYGNAGASTGVPTWLPIWTLVDETWAYGEICSIKLVLDIVINIYVVC